MAIADPQERPIGFGRLKRKEDARFIRGKGTYLDRYASVAQGIERWFPVPKVAGSIPVGGTERKAVPKGRLFAFAGHT